MARQHERVHRLVQSWQVHGLDVLLDDVNHGQVRAVEQFGERLERVLGAGAAPLEGVRQHVKGYVIFARESLEITDEELLPALAVLPLANGQEREIPARQIQGLHNGGEEIAVHGLPDDE